jgi:hypothetical protein
LGGRGAESSPAETQRLISRTKLNIALCAALCALPIAARAQEAVSQPPLPQFAAQIKAVHPKTVVFVFDVSASTKHGGVFSRERAATATLLRQGCVPGDRVILKSFGTGAQTVFDKTLTTSADAAALIDQIPATPAPGQGTNIREPHHEALKAIEEDLPHPGVVVLLTDSFNDRPLETDPNYPAYLSYYTLKGLTVYPSTSENRGYEGLLSSLKSSDKLTEYGVGVGIAESGRPIERLPVGPDQLDDNATQTTTTTIVTPATPEKAQSNLPMIIGGVIAALAILAFAVMSAMRSPKPLRLKLGDKGRPMDYRLRPGAKVQLGGSLGSGGPGDETFALSGLAKPAAAIEWKSGGLSLAPVVKDGDAVKVYHNGTRLENSVALRTGDEIRVSVPATDAAPEREHRVRVADPKEEIF